MRPPVKIAVTLHDRLSRKERILSFLILFVIAFLLIQLIFTGSLLMFEI